MRHIWACQVFLLHINNIFFLLSLRCADRLFPTWFYHGNGLFFTSDSRFFITKKKEIPRVQGRRFLYADTDSLHLRNLFRLYNGYRAFLIAVNASAAEISPLLSKSQSAILFSGSSERPIAWRRIISASDTVKAPSSSASPIRS